MPEKSQTITVAGYDSGKLQAIVYGALENIGWTIKYAGENVIIAYTPRSWKKYEDQITIQSADNQLTVNSKMIHDELVDLMGRNKKNIAGFLAAFETAKAGVNDLSINIWNEKIALLKGDTVKAAEEEIKQAEEVDKVMNFSKSNLYLTYGIIGINLVVFILMVVGGASFIEPTGIDIIHWGANYGPLTLSGDWWRLITCVFVHIGIIHLLFNMYALYMAGVYLEPLLGKTRYIVAYLCSGVFASLVSLWWHKDPVPSAGASGAIFGMYGVFLALLITNIIPKQIRKGLLQSIAVFIIYNLAYGMKSGVDNAAHIGGLLSGFIIGYLYYLGMKGEKAEKKKAPIVIAIAILTLVATIFYLQNNAESSAARNKAKSEIDQYSYDDADKFNDKYNSIIEMQKKATDPLNDKTLTEEQLLEKIKTITIPEWEKADIAVKELKSYNVSDKAKQKAAVMQRYIDLRKEQAQLIQQLIIEKDESINEKISQLNIKLNEAVEELERL